MVTARRVASKGVTHEIGSAATGRSATRAPDDGATSILLRENAAAGTELLALARLSSLRRWLE